MGDGGAVDLGDLLDSDLGGQRLAGGSGWVGRGVGGDRRLGRSAEGETGMAQCE